VLINSINKPLISIILAVYNGSDTICHCIDSIYNQTYENIEVIVIDGGSDDGTVDIIMNKYAVDYFISEKDDGIYHAWNKGLSKVKGEWIYFIGSDDYLWSDDVFEKLFEYLINISIHINIVYGKVMMLNTNGEKMFLVGQPWDEIKYSFKRVMSLPHQGVMHRKVLFDKYGKFDESFRINGDHEFLMRELLTSIPYYIPDIVFAGHSMGGISTNRKNALLLLFEQRKAQKIHGIKCAGINWIKSMIKAYLFLFSEKIIGSTNTEKIINKIRIIKTQLS
jgi:glycosyltransferase involved in cell wall biosynthesis